MVLACYVNSQVGFFANRMVTIQLELEKTPDKYTWSQVTEHALQYYISLHQYWTPGGNVNGVSKSAMQEFKSTINSLQQSVNSLKLKVKGE